VQTKFLVAYVSVWQSTRSQIVAALFEMMSSKFIYASLGSDRSPYACCDLLNLLIHFIAYLSSWLIICYPCNGLFMWIHSCFASLDMMMDIIA
jgi:hypothetical protein